eukprot:TRINITY_DN22136_c0_g1_i2.p1 TRINITY_DN22136_c0_g1~~TRINITY_DN22136_c0_g1_i2.p1  ORF type:complete len:152 (+),score=14.96 TRINITY_DN22136_c0_g1_i2:106-561(+)
MESILARRGLCVFEDPDAVFDDAELRSALKASTPKLMQGPPLPIPGKWKLSYAYAELDSTRDKITREEISYFRWQLVYQGRASRLGLRHFQRDGLFVSPHMGHTQWLLDAAGNFSVAGMAPLRVERNEEDWGWVIGKNTATEYQCREITKI